jgi:hypothetical protein
VAYFGPHITRALELLTVGAGETGYTIPLGHFRLPAGDLEACESDAAERAVEVSIPSSAPLGGHQNPLVGRDLRTSPLLVRVAYRFHEEGTLDAGVDAADLGGADRASIEARASEDAALIAVAVGWQPSWADLTPVVVIDCAPDPEGWALADAPVNGRLILTVPFTLTTRAAFPGSHGPAAS